MDDNNTIDMNFFKKGMTLKALLQNPELLNLRTPKAVSIGETETSDKKQKDLDSTRQTFTGQAAFLGQNVWDKTLPHDATGDFKDFNLEYMDLDEFLTENSIPTNEELTQLVGDLVQGPNIANNRNTEGSVVSSNVNVSINLNQVHNSDVTTVTDLVNLEESTSRSSSGRHSRLERSFSTSSEESQEEDNNSKVSVDFDLNPEDLELARIPGQDSFDPRRRAFSEEELRPQPIIKKSRKIFVPNESKDEKYWHRRKKNNVAAKRSREARRIKENQITLRAAYLEKENNTLQDELLKVKEENSKLKARLSKYE